MVSILSNPVTVPIIAIIVGAILSIITYLSTERRFRLTSLVEAFHILNDAKHREARKVIYDNPTSLSFEILGLKRPTSEDGVTTQDILNLSRDIVRSDFNEIGTLVHYNLLDGKIFVEEYYWVILKVWHVLEEEITQRRKHPGPPNYMEHFEEMRNKALKYAKSHYKDVYKEFSGAQKDRPVEA